MVPLHVAAKEGRFKAVGLLEAADVNVKDNNGVSTAELCFMFRQPYPSLYCSAV